MSDGAMTKVSNKPQLASVTAGKRYAWCKCGKSQRQPFCDGSHKGTNIEPVVFTAKASEDLLLCGCKHTQNPPFCDGSHNNLEDEYAIASQAEIAETKNALHVPRENGAYGKSELDGGAYVVTPDPTAMMQKDKLSWQSLIGRADGARNLDLIRFTTNGTTPWRTYKGGDTVLYVVAGRGAINIEGKRFNVSPETGIYVRMGEAFRLEAIEDLDVMAAVSPEAEPAAWPEKAAGSFTAEHAERCVGVDVTAREKMADRFYQVLIDGNVGSADVTQFIGEIPQSRAAFHRHLYEEAIVILSGAGTMWTRARKTSVATGDVIYLPPRQEHSLECTASEGMRLMGVFYPSGSPAINY
ncbi:MAG: CDGSH iron-sulfur domain-containing protein [Pseudomonadota bacterium]